MDNSKAGDVAADKGARENITNRDRIQTPPRLLPARERHEKAVAVERVLLHRVFLTIARRGVPLLQSVRSSC